MYQYVRVRIIVELRKRLVGKTAGHFPILTSTVCWSQFLQKSFKIYQKLSKIFQNPPKDTKTFDFPFRKFFGVNSLLKIQNRLELSYLDIEIGNNGSLDFKENVLLVSLYISFHPMSVC